MISNAENRVLNKVAMKMVNYKIESYFNTILSMIQLSKIRMMLQILRIFATKRKMISSISPPVQSRFYIRAPSVFSRTLDQSLVRIKVAYNIRITYNLAVPILYYLGTCMFIVHCTVTVTN